MRVYVVRHGESEGNIVNMWNQPHDIALTPTGQKQAQIVGKRLAEVTVDRIIASDMKRAKQTAETIHAARGDAAPIEFSPLLREYRDPSSLLAKRWQDPEVKAFLAKHRQEVDNPDFRIEDEETHTEFHQRAKDVFSFLEKREEKHLVLVSHGGFINLLAAHVVLGAHLTPSTRWHFFENTWHSNTGITIFDQWEPGMWRLLSWNDHAHLA